MQFDLVKLIKNLLFVPLRDRKLVQMIFVLVSEARTSFNAFMLNVPDWKYKARANASVLSLQETIKRELDVDAVITELDGKPVDFLVSVTGIADEVLLKNLIDKHKLAGRSYVFKIGSVDYIATFTNHVCEDIIEVFTAAFTSYVCEDDLIVKIYASTLKLPNDTWSVRISAQKAVTSNVNVSGIVYFKKSAGTSVASRYFSGEIAIGETYKDVNIGVVEGSYIQTVTEIDTIVPESDLYYIYQID